MRILSQISIRIETSNSSVDLVVVIGLDFTEQFEFFLSSSVWRVFVRVFYNNYKQNGKKNVNKKSCS